MLENATQCLKNYLYSNYESDKQNYYYGFLTIKGRLISVIDIPSQIAKAAIIPSMYLVLALYAGSAAGLRITFKVIPQAILSITPRTDHEYWKKHSAINWTTATFRLAEFAAYSVNAVCRLIDTLGAAFVGNTVGCTISPGFGQMWRISIADKCRSIETMVKFSYYKYQKGIILGNETINVDIKQLNLPPDLQQPVQDVVNEFNYRLKQLNLRPELQQHITNRTFVFSTILMANQNPDPAAATDESSRERRIWQYMRRVPGDTSDRQFPDPLLKNSIMRICLQRLLKAGAIFSYGATVERDRFRITA